MASTSRRKLRRLRDRWNAALRPRRLWMRLRTRLSLHDGVSVVIVNWNSLPFLQTSIAAVRHFAPTARKIVVDNASSDGSQAWLAAQRDITTVAFPTNLGHGPGLDAGFLRARTRYVIALDVDAFPISEGWLDALLSPLHNGATVVGAHGGDILERLYVGRAPSDPPRDFVHPCCLAMDLRYFVRQGHSFLKRKRDGVFLDPGEGICDLDPGPFHYLEPTSSLGPGAVGTVFAEVVYHNFYGTRHQRELIDEIDGVSQTTAQSTWDRAVGMYLGDRFVSPTDRPVS